MAAMTFMLLAAAAALAFIPAAIAGGRGRSVGAWWLYGFLLFPVALLHALLTPPTDKATREDQALQGFKRCPFCAEMIRPDAIVCRYCARDLPAIDADAARQARKAAWLASAPSDGKRGWHLDPSNAEVRRFWNGRQWTDEIRSASPKVRPRLGDRL